MTAVYRTRDAAIEAAARHILEARDNGPEAILFSDVMTRFGLTSVEALEAAVLAGQWSSETPRGTA